MRIQENSSLKKYNTFHIEAKARYFVEVTCVEDILAILADERFVGLPRFILGGGSNVLFTHDFDGVVIWMNLKGIEEMASSSSSWHMYIKVMAWENWGEFVRYSLMKWWYGLENLSDIPGTVGAAPIQNIGAYWVEVCELIESVEWMDYETGKIQTFTADESQFWYRESIFKNELKGKWLVISVLFRLSSIPTIRATYGAIWAELDARGIISPTPVQVSEVVIGIRKSKLPDPEIIGNAWSFFKNPYVCLEHFNHLKAEYPTMPSYITNTPDIMKLAAGWLIEQADWKWRRLGDAGVHDKQALVLVNHGDASWEDILSLAREIQKSVFAKFFVNLDMEVNIV